MTNKIHNHRNIESKSRMVFILFAMVVMILQLTNISALAEEQEGGETVAFEIKGFTIEGSTLLTEDEMKDLLTPHVGKSMTATDVEKARDSLESFYHKSGYIAVLVNIPEQDVESGLIRLEVIESRIGKIRVDGNRYFTQESILKRLPSLKEGGIIYLPAIQQEFSQINRNTDFKVSPTLVPAKEIGWIDVDLKVVDSLPLHGSLEINNRSSHNTTSLRTNGSLTYSNLWQKEHSLSIQYQTSPQDMDKVRLLAGSYVLSAPWNDNHVMAIYAVWSDSDNAFGEGFQVIGKGKIFGARYIIPFPSLEKFTHSATLGLDYKDFNEDVNFKDAEEEGFKTPIKYLPFSASYTGGLSDRLGKTQLSLGFYMSFRNLVADQREFEIKRYLARGNYLYMTAGIERTNKLPCGMSLFAKAGGQIASEPLISNEQYVAGGMESVRGYKESEISGDNALYWTANIYFPELSGLWESKSPISGLPYIFYDRAKVWKKDPLEGEDRRVMIHGAGAGIKGDLLKGFEYRVDWAIALEDTDDVESGDDSFYFRLKYGF